MASLNFSKPQTYNLFMDVIRLKSGKDEPLPLRSLILLFHTETQPGFSES